MVDYNDGKWHAWDGGECPVHPKSVVEVFIDGEKEEYKACGFMWNHEGSADISAFRVVKQYIEPPKPREFWIIPESGRCFSSWPSIPSAIHVREVLE